MSVVHISTKSKSYEVRIEPGLRHTLYNLIHAHKMSDASSFLIITDEHVHDLYINDVLAGFPKQDHVYVEKVASGESSKSFEVYQKLQERALQIGLDRKSVIIALGGGVIGDLAGFVAATYMRGVRFVQVPTTLLAHDSSVGGKVAINLPGAKNIVGAFFQPELVIYDTEMLHSLPEREWRSGFAEVVKHGFIRDREFLDWLKGQVTSFDQFNDEFLKEMLVQSIGVKADIVSADETEQGIRAYLNFGHTLGHAIEAELGYGELSHGEAVAVGMIFALRLSERVFQVELPVKETITWLETLGYSTNVPKGLSAEQLLASMKKDKKTTGGLIRMVLVEECGKAVLKDVADEPLLDSLHKAIEEGFDDSWN
ncbi:3-dehydroquinate synthase [Alkalihalophilus marmarensis]|uniref:3-dehydroquinate synthase n=1 Tax=Alkalihalophilus marmarensis TaxID=521377 RepID=UPI002DBE4B7D|nr:3-dehydroquinate synthase [Alkalihalophilus marmarensis]MEC2070820.1 3-dehydroquinate synthase [Alkalihalophilus marmarensis]